MANKNVPIGGDTTFQKQWIDQGSGNFAEAVALVGSGSGGVATVQGAVADGGLPSNPFPMGVLESATVERLARAVNAPFADLSVGKGVAAVNMPGLATSGTLAAPGTVTLNPVGGATVVGILFSGTYTGVTATFQMSPDNGVSWRTQTAYPDGSGAGITGITTAATTGFWAVAVSGATQFRVNVTAIASGTITINLQAGIGPYPSIAQVVQGVSANGAAITNVNPIILGGRSGSNGQYIDVLDGSADGTSTFQNTPTPNLRLYNENNGWDRQRCNTVQTAFASAARTSTPAAVNITNYNGRGIMLFVDVTVAASALALTPSVTIRDSVGATAFTAWTAAAQITATGAARYVYMLYPGSAAAVSWTESKETAFPRQITINMTHGNANSVTYSVTVHSIV